MSVFGLAPYGVSPWGADPGGAVTATRDTGVTIPNSLFGLDLFFDVGKAAGASTATSASGDWVLVSGREALRQAIIRRIITSPSEWPTLDNYGIGARLFVKERNTAASRLDLEERIRGQLLLDKRVKSVDNVFIEFSGGVLKIAVVITPRGEALKADQLIASIEVT